MSDAVKVVTTLVTPVAILSYPFLSKTRRNDDGTEKYGAVLVFEKDKDLAAMKAAVRAAGVKKFGDEFAGMLKRPGFRLPFRSTDAEGQTQYPAGSIFMNTSSTDRPQLVGPDKTIIADVIFYAGCRVRAYLNAFGYDKKGNKGVSLGLNALQFVMDGQRLDNRKSADEVFDTILAETPAGDLDIGL